MRRDLQARLEREKAAEKAKQDRQRKERQRGYERTKASRQTGFYDTEPLSAFQIELASTLKFISHRRGL